MILEQLYEQAGRKLPFQALHESGKVYTIVCKEFHTNIRHKITKDYGIFKDSVGGAWSQDFPVWKALM